jgi:general stress protein YciG
MAGTKAGGLAAARTNKAKYGKEFYAKIGAMGGRKGTTGGFYYSMINGLDTHIKAGRKGGEISRRKKKSEY